MKLLLLGDSAVGKLLPQFRAQLPEMLSPRSIGMAVESPTGLCNCNGIQQQKPKCSWNAATILRSSLLLRFCESKFDANFVLTIGRFN